MSRPDKITIAIVTFNKDFHLLVKLINSIYRNWSRKQIDSIKIILNDPVIFKGEFDKIVSSLRNNKFTIDVFYMYELEPRTPCFDWHSQQMAKCLISKYITTDWYLIHDCKDYYISPVSIEDCFDEFGKAVMPINQARYNSAEVVPYPGSHWGFGPFNTAYQNCCGLYGLDHRDHKQKHLPTGTPFFVKTEHMSDMIDQIKDMFKDLFPFMFALHLDGQVFVTEFLLYNAYCTSKNDLSDYVDWRYNQRKFFTCVVQSLEGRMSLGGRVASNPKIKT